MTENRKILCKEVGDPFEEFSKSRTPAGRIIEDSEYYSLSAMDTEGRLWTANRVLSPSTRANPYCLTVSCNVRELMSVYELKTAMTRSSLQIWFPGEIDIPCNTATEMTISIRRKERDRSSRLNIAILETNEFSIEIKKERNWLQLHATSASSQITEDVIRAILESLQFVLAWPLEWSIAQLVQGTKQITKMRAALENKPPDRRRSPLSTSDPDKINHIWNIFDK